MRLFEIFSYIISRKGKTVLRQWIRACYRRLLHRIISLCLICEIKFENIPKGKIEPSCKDLDDYIEEKKNNGYGVIDQVRGFSEEKRYEKHLCMGNEIHAKNVKWVSRIVTAGDIISFVFGIKNDEYLDDIADSPMAVKIIEKEIQKLKRRKKPLGEMRGRLPIIWVTKSSELETLKQNSNPQNLAAIVADRMGMGHLTRGYLIEIQIPLNSLGKLHTPTIFDANFRKYFFPAKESDKWGRTLRIRTLQRCMPEAVHRSLIWEKSFPFSPLGMLDSNIDEPSEKEWKSLYDTIINELMTKYPEYKTEHEELFAKLEG